MAAHPHWPAQDWLQPHLEKYRPGDHKSPTLIASIRDIRAGNAGGQAALARTLKDAGKIQRRRRRWCAASGARPTSIPRWRRGSSPISAIICKNSITNIAPTACSTRAGRAGPARRDAGGSRCRRAGQGPRGGHRRGLQRQAARRGAAALRADAGYKFALSKRRRAQRSPPRSASWSRRRRDPAVPSMAMNGGWSAGSLPQAARSRPLRTAYSSAPNIPPRRARSKIEAEFHAGWIALRFLNDPASGGDAFCDAGQARGDADVAGARRLLARAGGRSRRKRGHRRRARGFYQQAAAYLDLLRPARARQARPTAAAGRAAGRRGEGDARDETVKTVELLYAIGEKDVATPARRRCGAPSRRSGAGRGAGAGRRQAAGRACSLIGKLAGQRGIRSTTSPSRPMASRVSAFENSADASIVYSIARQESAFDRAARAPAPRG